jgi:hypothetical protein
MISVRLGESLEARLRRAATLQGIPVSQFVRDAVDERCNATLGLSVAEALADYIGAFESDGTHDSRNSEEEFGRIVEEKHRR